jgi:3-(3-hydroxy-phenyl)propionate hydroxylase
LNTPDADPFGPRLRPGSPCIDAPVSVNGRAAWFLGLLGDRFTAVYFAGADDAAIPAAALPREPVPVALLVVRPAGAAAGAGEIGDSRGLLARHYDARPGTLYLVRPDQHVAARWRTFDPGKVNDALLRCLCSA